jgi:plasmid stability protein
MAAGGGSMAQLTARDVPDDLAHAKKVRAARRGRSADFWARAEAFRNRSQRQKSDSAPLQRKMLDAR